MTAIEPVSQEYLARRKAFYNYDHSEEDLKVFKEVINDLKKRQKIIKSEDDLRAIYQLYKKEHSLLQDKYPGIIETIFHGRDIEIKHFIKMFSTAFRRYVKFLKINPPIGDMDKQKDILFIFGQFYRLVHPHCSPAEVSMFVEPYRKDMKKSTEEFAKVVKEAETESKEIADMREQKLKESLATILAEFKKEQEKQLAEIKDEDEKKRLAPIIFEQIVQKYRTPTLTESS